MSATHDAAAEAAKRYIDRVRELELALRLEVEALSAYRRAWLNGTTPGSTDGRELRAIWEGQGSDAATFVERAQEARRELREALDLVEREETQQKAPQQ